MSNEDGRENPIVARSRAALIGAADRLLEERAAAEISVKDVVAAAGMSRPTFYQHFADLGSLFAAAGLARLTAMFARVELTDPDEPAAMFGLIVRQMEQHAGFYSRVHASQGGSAFYAGAVRLTAAWLRQLPSLSELRPEDEASWEFLAAGVVWIITRHLAAYCRNPEDTSLHPEADLARIVQLMNDSLSTMTVSAHAVKGLRS